MTRMKCRARRTKRRAWRFVIELGVVATCVGCGPEAALWVRVEAPLLVPDECDAVQVSVELAEETVRLYDKVYDLSSGPPFPLTLALSTSDSDRLERDLTVTATALKGGELARPWATMQGTTRLRAGEIVQVLLQLCDGCAREDG